MSLAATAVHKKTVTYFGAFLIFVAGIASFFSLGQLEDPDFTVKTALISTNYPGASPEEVELEVTDRIELALQKLSQVKYLTSFSRAGQSLIWVELIPKYTTAQIPQIWDEMRRKITDVQGSLPPGASVPAVNDEFGDVFGHMLAIIGDGFSYAELERYAKDIRKELSVIEGVAKVDLWGVQKKVIYLDVSEAQMSQLGMSVETLERALRNQNLVVDAGNLDLQNRRLRISPTGAFQSAEDISELAIRPSLLDELSSGAKVTSGRSSELIRIRDIGTISQGYQEPSDALMRFNGKPAITMAISNIPGVNVVDMGGRIRARLHELQALLPVGIEVQPIHVQSAVVAEAVNGFLISFAQALAIVLIVLTIGMGWRLSLIIGFALTVTILGSFLLMAIFSIDLQRMSLGALIIALGMMVDNAIVVADGFSVRLQQGMDRTKAAIESAELPSIPLLGATIVAVMAFYPIVASDESAGEYCASLFSVVAISLLVSWLVSVTLTPVQCMDLLPDPEEGAGGDPYGSAFFRGFRRIVETAIRGRWLTIGAAVALLVFSAMNFGNVKQLFFPDSSMTKFMINYWAPEGARIEDTSEQLRALERKLLDDPRVEAVSSFIGSGPPRFYLPVEPEKSYSAYGLLLVNVKDYREIDGLIEELEPWLETTYPEALVPMQKFGVGPADVWKFEARISGPAVADPDVLRRLSVQVTDILATSPMAGLYQTDWRQRVQKVVPVYNDERGRWAGVSREDIAGATKRAFDGRTVGLYREQDDLIPIVIRQVEAERRNVGGLDVIQVQPGASTHTVPLAQVTDSVQTRWEDPLIWRRDRRRTITVQANPVLGATLTDLRNTVVEEIEQIELPPGYTLEWGGEYESSTDAQTSLLPGMIPAAIIMAFIVVALFNAMRPPLVILFTIPFAMIGVIWGLLGTGAPFGFVALLAAMSLVGMMIKNAVVLLDQADLNLEEGMDRYEAIIGAALSRVRPVVLAAATTVLGVIPLLQDVFWIGLAITLMAGLTFGTILTMVLVPVLYSTLYRIKSPASA